ncbi:MAG: NUDIX domain-containing protein [Patescibacteria group bacterium]
MKVKKYFYQLVSPIRRLYWFIFRPKTTGVKCLILHQEKVLMIRNSYGIGHWTLPGGKIKRKELPKLAVKREINEEVGINLHDVVDIGQYFNIKEYKQDTVHCFFARINSFEFKIDSSEIREANWADLKNLPDFQSSAVRKVLNLAKQKGLLPEN